jgi:polysaccharide deacetylase family protein (PEP-CTERM system associated)
MPDAPRFGFYPRSSDGLLELPVTTVRLFNRNFPAGGGGYFRLWPYPVSRWFLQKLNRDEQRSAIFYFHPWEIDHQQPRQSGISAKTRFRHYVNLHRMEDRIKALTRDFQWNRMDRIFLGQSK